MDENNPLPPVDSSLEPKPKKEKKKKKHRTEEEKEEPAFVAPAVLTKVEDGTSKILTKYN